MNEPIHGDVLRNAQAILKSVAIPAQPQTVIELMKMTNSQNVDLDQIARQVGKDPSLAAKVLKMVNSPLFGMRRPVDSIAQALNLMGLQLFRRAVLASALRETMSAVDSGTCDAFWTHSELVARCCEVVAKKLRPELVQQAYLAGLFHDCAMLILRKKFPDYDDILRQAFHYLPGVIAEEDGRYATNHCVMGYFFTRSWHLPEAVRLVILRHHDVEPNYTDGAEIRALVAVLRVSEYIVQDYDVSGNMRTLAVEKWMDINSKMLDVLGMVPQDMEDFEEELLDIINRAS